VSSTSNKDIPKINIDFKFSHFLLPSPDFILGKSTTST